MLRSGETKIGKDKLYAAKKAINMLILIIYLSQN